MATRRDFRNLVNAVIDEASFDNCMEYIEYAKNSPEAEILFGAPATRASAISCSRR